MKNLEYAGITRDGQSAGRAGLRLPSPRDYQEASRTDGGIVRPATIIRNEIADNKSDDET